MKILLEGVRKTYGARTVVDQVTLGIEQGEVVGLLGPNGAGKTTTFYLATGLEKPDQGRVWLDRDDITPLPLHRRARLGIGYLPQEPSIFRNLTVAENILLVLEQTKVPRHLWADRLDHLLADLNLHKIAQIKGNRVSGGERRRTELARALAMGVEGPKFLFLDEPFAGVDPIAVGEIQTIVTQLRAQNLGILITDHNVRETLSIVDRAYIMRDGHILAAGAAADLYEDPLVRQYYLGENFVP
ncbi:LPS export ABC transporter ATP-binding protein [Synechococcus sp. PCC 6312]|uniref:LPS export ABC transporter ATP-binding protein n=1 Tax=Synechococcus sp. (strain ATCC 27167 / PCC 6312) TaxID=195253 RepID=UPI00029EE19D|nr:LPS export ABC transporter ATP-binding protein [Synechococcus sp. PCC 6312]AFY62647.1 ABC-type (unclassified) transport system, ATPase component [Synechococcus sp. PCC 6312]